MSAAAAAAPGGSEALQAEAFQRLYPDQYLAKFVAQGLRPDGRPLALPRATSIGLGVVTTADASALVKIGSTSVLAGAKCEVMPASADEPDKGRLAVQVGADACAQRRHAAASHACPHVSPAPQRRKANCGDPVRISGTPRDQGWLAARRGIHRATPAPRCAGGDGAAVLGRVPPRPAL